MPEHIHYEDEDIFNPETHHEHSDVPVRPLWWAVAIFIIFAVITHFLIAGMYKVMAKNERERMDPPQTTVVRPDQADVPQNQPLLQPFPHENVPPNRNTPVTDLDDMRRTEEQALSSYGWVDKQNGVVRIPIDAAKDLLIQRGIPTGTPASPPADPVASTPPPATTTAPTTTGGTP